MIMHKYIIEYIDRMIENQILYMTESNSDLITFKKIFIDAPLLFETGLADRCDEVWLIMASDEKRIERAAKKYLTTRENIKKRIEHQMPDNDKAKLADIIIENNEGIDELIVKVKELL
jgi:dephospho-CoA kinase